MKTRLYLFLILFYFQILQSQTTIPLDNPITPQAFNKAILNDINFMVIGDNNVKQGVSYELKEKNTELTLNGKLYSNSNFIMTIDGQFGVNDGIYIFDDKDGSKKSKLSLNFFINGFRSLNTKSYVSKSASSTQYMMIKNHEYLNKVNDTIYKGLVELHIIMSIFQLPTNTIRLRDNISIGGVFFPAGIITAPAISNYETLNNASILNRISNYLPNSNELIGADLNSTRANIAQALNDNTQRRSYQFNGTIPLIQVITLNVLNINRLINDYDKAYKRELKFREESMDIEIKNFKDSWTQQTNNYFGISPYYERQGLDIYRTDSISFSNNFKETRGDLFGLKLSYNYVLLKKNKSFIIARALTNFGRDSNFKEFNKKDYEYTLPIGEINSLPLVTVDKKTAYQHKTNSEYSYGLLQQYNLELYASLSTMGVFAKIGYSNNDILASPEAYPFEAGLLFNLKSEKKNIVSILLFVNRVNLKTNPDQDMNFGFKLGLPINLEKS